MVFLRTFAVWTLCLPLTVVAFVLMLFMLPFDRKRSTLHRIAAVWARAILALAGVSVSVKGVENIPRGAPVVFLSNHQGAFDIPALHAFIPVQFSWVAKESLFRIPVLGWSMSLAGYIGIDRDNPAEAMKSVDEASSKVRNGVSVLVFPEGTRSRTGELLPFKRGAFVLAKRSGAPIVPVAISGTNRIMKKGGVMIRPAKVSIRIGEPIRTDSPEKDLRNRTKKAVEALFHEGARSPA